jgi:hypothetical protein
MIRIAITQAAFKAIARSLPLGSVGYENQMNERGERLIWLDRAVVDRLRSLRGAGENYSDVILRIAEPLRNDAFEPMLAGRAPGKPRPRRLRGRCIRSLPGAFRGGPPTDFCVRVAAGGRCPRPRVREGRRRNR